MIQKLLSTAVAIMIALTASNVILAQSNKQDFYPDWAKVIEPKQVDRKPTSTVVADEQGNVYQFMKVTGGLDFGQSNDVSFGSKTVAVLSKFDNKGKMLWYRVIEGGMVSAEALTLAGNRLYIAGSHSNDLRNPKLAYQTGLELVADKGNKGIKENTIPTDKKSDDDIYLAVYDLEGNLKALRSIQSNVEARGRIETVKQVLRHNNKTYLIGKSICYSSFGKNPSFDNLTIQVGASNEFAFVFVLDDKLKLEKIYSMVATDDSDITFSGITAYGERVFLTGSTNALKPLRYNGNQELKVQGTALVYAELNPNNNEFKVVRSLGQQGSWTLGYTILASKEGVFLAGKSGENVQFPLLAGKQSKNLNGAFIAKWDIAKEQAEAIYPIGSNNEDNVVGALALAKGGKLIIAGDFYETFNAIDPPTLSLGESDSYIGLFDLKTGAVEKLYAYGSIGLDEVQSLSFNEQTENFYFSGFYSGASFNLYGLDEVKKSKGYYFACKHLEDKSATALEEIQAEQYIRVEKASITWLRSSAYVLYNLQGVMLQRGQARQGESLRLNQGMYILRLANGQAVKVLIQN